MVMVMTIIMIIINIMMMVMIMEDGDDYAILGVCLQTSYKIDNIYVITFIPFPSSSDMNHHPTLPSAWGGQTYFSPEIVLAGEGVVP